MYQLGVQNAAADFFKEQEDLKTSRTNRAIAEAAELRTQSKHSRAEEVQSITDKTLKNFDRLSRGEIGDPARAVEGAAEDLVAKSEKPFGAAAKVEPLDITLGKMADTVGNTLMQAGFGTEGMAYVKEGLEYADRIAAAEKARAEDAIKASDRYIKVADYVYEGLADVRSQEDQDRFLSQLPQEMIEAIGAENIEQMRQIPYSPDIIEHYRDRTLSTKETYTLNRLAEEQQMRADRDAALAFDRQARTRIAEQARADRAKADAAKASASGKSATITALPNEISQATTQIIATVFKGQKPKKGSPDEVIISAAANNIATEAKQMAKDNPGLTYDQALTRVVTSHRGDFITPKVTVPTEKYLFGKIPTGIKGTREKKGSLEFAPKGSSKNRPIILTDRDAGKKLVPGKWYSNGSKTMQYNPE